MFNFCPSCASKKISFNEGKVFRCSGCGFTYYHNIAAATGCLISVPDASCNRCTATKVSRADGEKLLFTIRGREPAAGKLDLPGGFVDIGEGVLEGLYRELQEEIGWTPPQLQANGLQAGCMQACLADVFRLYASFSNVYLYKGIEYNTCDMYFSVCAPGLSIEDLHLDQSEISGVCFLKPQEIDYERFAFPSTIKAVKAYLGIRRLD